MSLKGQVALVTGASRGIGKGIALQLGEAGAIVYITGRTLQDGDSLAPGSLQHTVLEIAQRGGKAIAIACDHNKDADVEAVFQQIVKEQGRLDILVNNAYAAVNLILENFGRPFWEFPEDSWDVINGAGLRNHYQCSVKAAKIMTKQKSGLIVNVSSIGGKFYFFAPAYGIGKAAVDRMAADCGLELKAHNVSFISLWPGPVKTELITAVMQNRKAGGETAKPVSQETLNLGANARGFDGFEEGESIEFSGKCIVALATDKKVLARTGNIFTTASLGKDYGLKDIDGREIQWILPEADTK